MDIVPNFISAVEVAYQITSTKKNMNVIVQIGGMRMQFDCIVSLNWA